MLANGSLPFAPSDNRKRSQVRDLTVSIDGFRGEIRMAKPPVRRRPTDALSIAEAVFKPAPPAAADPVREAKSAIPVSKEQVSIRLDSDLLAHFQEDGPGWQERINDALRQYLATRP
ncbi:BrnA antitoxin family protein [Nostoc sp. NIES-2111]